ncbi:DoxX family membrane protein, partial [Schumannella luteola]
MNTTRGSLVASILLGATRVALGAFWLNEGLFKYQAGFAGDDIRLVVDGATRNSRVPEYFQAFADGPMRAASELLGFVIPLLETGLGVVLVLGLLTFPAALGSVLTLMLYWSADQLIAQYPVMVVLSLPIVAWPLLASRFGLTSLLERMRLRRHPDARPLA